MSDLISRQALCEYALNQKNKSVTPNDIMRFPSAHPEPCDDAISRQDAIDACIRVRELRAYDEIEEIKALPSAQPERTCVNCGRTVNNGGWYADGGTRCPIEEHYALPKDGYCHLWEKRNVTDDDYPERREK